jgi:hypothetical protein
MRRLERPTAPADIVKLIEARECEISAWTKALKRTDLTAERRRVLQHNLRGLKANQQSWKDHLVRCR